MNYDILFAFMSATAVLAISPGPDNIYVLTQSMVYGKKYGIATVIGLISGCLVHTALLAFGVSAIIKANASLFTGIKVFGVLYLLYLAYKVYISKNIAVMPNASNTAAKSLGQLVKQGFVMNVLNPKVTIFFLAFFPGFLFSDTMDTVTQFFILGFLFMLISALIFGAIAILAGAISVALKSKKLSFFLKWLQIIVFVGIALYLLFSDQ